MEQKFKSLTIFEFQNKFPDVPSCLEYLSAIKWGQDFTCVKCGHHHYFEVNQKSYIRQCTSCRHTESATAGTLFHKVKFSILKAFYIIYYVSNSKKGISSTELSRRLGLRQKTCWYFKQKVMSAMKSSGNHPMKNRVEVDETVIGGQEEGVRGRKNESKKLVAVAIEHTGKGVSRMYAKVIQHASSKELGKFMRFHIDPDTVIKTDKWAGYTPLKKDFSKLIQVKSGSKGNNFPEMHRVIMGLKGWLRGIHHHVENLQAYLDEYSYRFNRNFMKKGIFDNLLSRMMICAPYYLNRT